MSRRGRRIGLSLFVAASLSGCWHADSMRRAPGQFDQVVGPRVTSNTTPLAPAFACMRAQLATATPVPLKIGIGQVRDYTGKFSELDGGSAITQGGSLMTISAVGKLQPSVRVFERFDTTVPEWELGFMSKRFLGDEKPHAVDNGNGRIDQVPWMPYMGGTVVNTDYFIVGGITELNYSVYSDGLKLGFNQIGPSSRTYVANVAVDLRLIDTRSLEMIRSVTLQKQVIGYEVGFSIFKFFDDTLVDFEAGSKNNEPMQLAVRTTLEQAVLELLGKLAGVDADNCIDKAQKGAVGAGMALSGTLARAPDAPAPAGPGSPRPMQQAAPSPDDGRGLSVVPAPPAEPALPPAPATAFPAAPDTAKPAVEPGSFGPRGIGPDSSRRPREAPEAP